MASKPLNSNIGLTLKRRIKAPPQKVYDAWTQPEKMIQWWGVGAMVGGKGGGKTPIAETDLRIGGRFRVQFWSQDGDHNSASGEYREIVPGEKLVFSWSWQSTSERVSQVTLTFKPDGDATMLTLLHEMFFDEKARDSHIRGWTAALDNLEGVFA
jgi:uncharacterized protein YndB with AHSA1/START domain